VLKNSWFIQVQMEFMCWVYENRYRNALNRTLISMVSIRFMHDLSLCVAALGALCIWKSGYRVYWTLIIAYALFRFMRPVFPGKRPAEIDYRLRPKLSLRGNGSISPLVVFSVIVFYELSALLVFPYSNQVCLLFLMVFAYSRVLSMAHFPHQVLFSVVIGAVSMALARMIKSRLPVYTNSAKSVFALFGFVLLTFEIFLTMEQDRCEFRTLNIPKKEYIRVMNHIMSGDASVEQMQRQAAESDSRRKTKPKRDSFVKLIRSMERRALNVT